MGSRRCGQRCVVAIGSNSLAPQEPIENATWFSILPLRAFMQAGNQRLVPSSLIRNEVEPGFSFHIVIHE